MQQKNQYKQYLNDFMKDHQIVRKPKLSSLLIMMLRGNENM